MNYITIATISAIGGIFTYLYGAWDGVIIALVVVVILDYLTGVLAAGATGRLSSAVGFKGLLKKVCIFLVVALGGLLDHFIIGASGAIRQTVCVFYIVNECLSIIENAGTLGVPIPNVLKRAIAALKSDDEE